MSVRRLAAEQPADFAFTQDNLQWAEQQIAKYPEGRQASAVIPLLWKAQEQHHGWLPEPAIRRIAEMLGMPVIRVMEVATFYTMFNLSPVGEHFVQLCGTTPCMLRGANALKDVCRKVIGDERHVSEDGKLSWLEVECLGACSNAPMVQINYDYYEDLTPENFETLLEDLRAGRPVKTGSQTGRSCSAPEGGDTSLSDETLYDGSMVGAWRQRFEQQAAAGDATLADAGGKPADQSRPEAKAAADKGDAEAGKAKVEAVAATGAGEPKAPFSAPTVSGKSDDAPKVAGFAGQPAPGAVAEPEPVSDEAKPELLTAPREGKGDDLKMIWGVGPKLEAMLHSMGVFHFDQIAAWTDDNLRWVDQNLGSFKGRAVRERWIVQGKVLAEGGSEQDAEDAARRDRGETV
ncbi:NADH-quinone oxidoreductase subunit NuoE [Chenggangzhangella methanolivorans]|uniref:NADH-quinone oxidoreductase subunit NuoE n=1 Tax=Chenggangzhangella methanolivorans TaxID=1437009 RepID=A0A9E6RAK6_9HYPH|nr:NADH-quinone oxidoreductase subunit NuoE [Chenggangzhangella methanolivorans]QZN99828.1 NADH-quinone oxidoreductase subunit NuoE [Chenggangzhangella methanolivorans]